MVDSIGTPTPREGTRGRKTTSARGGKITPERAVARFTGKRRGQFPQENAPTPENAVARETGDPQSNTQKSNVVQPVITRKPGDANTLSNPLK